MNPWVTGDVITAERLNGMQKEPLIIHENTEGIIATFDKTWKEIRDNFVNGIPCIIYRNDNELSAVTSVTSFDDQYNVCFDSNGYITAYSANSENGYPYYSYD